MRIRDAECGRNKKKRSSSFFHGAKPVVLFGGVVISDASVVKIETWSLNRKQDLIIIMSVFINYGS